MLHHAVARRIPGPTQPKPNWLRLGHAASRASREEAVVFSIATAMKRARSAEARWCYVALVLQVQRQLELLQGDKEPRLGLQLREQARAKHKAAGGCRRLRGWRSELFEAFCQVLVEDAEKGSSAQAGSGAVSHCSVEFSFSKAPEQRPEAERPARPHTAEVRLTVESPLADPSQSSKPDSSSDAVKQQEVQEESVKLEAAEAAAEEVPELKAKPATESSQPSQPRPLKPLTVEVIRVPDAIPPPARTGPVVPGTGSGMIWGIAECR